jgi:hypothetical protein
MSKVDSLTKAKEKASVAFHQFTHIHQRNSECLYCFFEGGEDAKYYLFRIKENLPTADKEGIKDIKCGGKSIVLTVYELLQKHENPSYRKAKTAFFIDRDFDEPLSEELRKDIYETPCYSIENFYTTEDCFKDILKYEFKIDEFDPADEQLFKQSVDFFVEAQQAFHQSILEFNAWFKVIRKSGQKLKAKEFDSIDKLVKVEVHKVEKRYDIDQLYSLTELTRERDHSGIPLDEADLQQAQQSFSDYRCQFRGKQELGFFLEFLKKLKEDLCQSSPQHFLERKKISFPIPTSNALSALSQYADTPNCLRSYLRKFGI